MSSKPTIYEALAAKLGRNPTHRETCDDVKRILADGLIERAEAGKLSRQRKLNRAEKRTAQILAADAPVSLKISKLQTLALRCFASSPDQKAVIAAYKTLQEEVANG